MAKTTNLTILASVFAMAAGAASATNLEFQFNNPNFGGNPNNGAFLFGLADVQRTATIDPDRLESGAGIGGGGGQPTPGVTGGGSVGGPTIVIPINTGAPTDPTVDVSD